MSEKKENPYDAEHDPHHFKRDAETQTVLGIFITILSIPVLVGTAWAENYRQTVVNLTAGLVLLAIGIGVFVWGRKTSKRSKPS